MSSIRLNVITAESDNRCSNNLLWQMPEACVLIDPARDQILEANEKARRLFGLAAVTGSSSRFSIYFGPQLPTLIAFTQVILDKGCFWSNELLLYREEKTISLEINGRKISNQPGADSLILMSFRDARELEKLRTHSVVAHLHRGGLLRWKRIEKVFQEIERQNHLILSAAGEGIYGVEGKTTFVNPAAERMLGWDCDELRSLARRWHSRAKRRSDRSEQAHAASTWSRLPRPIAASTAPSRESPLARLAARWRRLGGNRKYLRIPSCRAKVGSGNR